MNALKIIGYFSLFVIAVFGYFYDFKKRGVIYSIIIGALLGIIAYHYLPPVNYDLYRHHLVVLDLIDKDFVYFINHLHNYDMDLLPALYSYIIAILKNINLQQFFIVSSGYAIILWIFQDLRKNMKIDSFIFIVVLLFTLFGFNALNFISGLWYYIATIIFFLAFYFEYYRKEKKMLCYLLYFLTILIHNTMIFAVGILLVYKLFKNKISLKLLMVVILTFFISSYFLNWINSYIDISFINSFVKMMNTYYAKNDYMHKFYSGMAFFIEMSKLIITLFIVLCQKRENRLNGINGFIILLALCTILMLPKSIVMIRFVMLIQFIGIIPVFSYFEKLTKNKLLMLFLLLLLLASYIVYFYRMFQYQAFI